MTTNTTTYAHSEEAKYIVSLNEKLLDESKQLRQEIAELRSEHDTTETELDQREKQVTYMRGLLKNFVELDTYKKKIIEEYKILKSDKQKLQVVYEKNQRHQHVGNILYMTLVTITFLFYLVFDLGTVEVMLACFFIDNSIKFYFFRKHNKLVAYKVKVEKFCRSRLEKIQNTSNEVDVIMKGCDFLNEYIDNI